MQAIISINDNNILIQQRDTIVSTQGYACLLDDEILFDFADSRSAIKSCRLTPQQIQNRYWQQCAQTSIGTNNSEVRNSADLIWRHMSSMREKFALDQVVFVVPSHYQQDNLQLLLGIANSAGLTPKGLVNKAVLVAQHQVQQDGNYFHIDLQLHQTVCSLVEVRQGVANLSDIDIVNDVSILQIQDALLRQMQQSFIQNDRFDPLHYADTEQQLFDQLSDVAKNIALEGKASIAVKHAAQLHSITFDSNQWNSVIEPFATKMMSMAKANKSAHILMQLNRLFAGIVPPSLNKAGVSLVEDSFLIKSNLVNENSFNDQGLVYRLELPLLQAKGQSEPVEKSVNKPISHTQDKPRSQNQVQASDTVTHLMQAGLAIPLQHTHINISAGQLELSHADISNVTTMLENQQLFILNDSKRSNLQLNDRLGSNHADGVINAIQVLE